MYVSHVIVSMKRLYRYANWIPDTKMFMVLHRMYNGKPSLHVENW